MGLRRDDDMDSLEKQENRRRKRRKKFLSSKHLVA